MIFKVLLMSLLFAIGPIKEKNQKNTGTVSIEFSGIDKGRGYIELSVFSSFKGFPNNGNTAFKTYRFKITSSKESFSIKDFPYGEYAISCFYDINNNKLLDTNFFGIPKEKVGASNNPTSNSIPSYKDAKFILNEPKLHLSITLK